MKTSMLTGAVTFFVILLTGTFVVAQQIAPIQTLVSSSGVDEAELPSRAKIAFSETMWDFGYVPKTGKVVHTYQIKNVGEDTLKIAKVRATCGCTSAPLSKQNLAPDETAELDVIFDPGKIKVGETTKRVHVISNDPDNPFAEIRFTARIGKSSSLVKITPASISFDTTSRQIEEVRILTIENTSGEKLSMTRTEGPGDEFDLDLENKVLEPGEVIQVTLKLKNSAPEGNLQASLTLDFECSKIARISIPIWAFIAER